MFFPMYVVKVPMSADGDVSSDESAFDVSMCAFVVPGFCGYVVLRL